MKINGLWIDGHFLSLFQYLLICYSRFLRFNRLWFTWRLSSHKLMNRSNARILQEVNKIMNQSWDNFLSLSFMDDSLTICNIIPLIWIVIIFSLITNRPLSLVNISSFFSLFLYRKVVCCWVPLDTNRLSILLFPILLTSSFHWILLREIWNCASISNFHSAQTLTMERFLLSSNACGRSLSTGSWILSFFQTWFYYNSIER